MWTDPPEEASIEYHKLLLVPLNSHRQLDDQEQSTNVLKVPHLVYGFRTFMILIVASIVKRLGGSSVFEGTYPLGMEDTSHNTFVPLAWKRHVVPQVLFSEPLTCDVSAISHQSHVCRLAGATGLKALRLTRVDEMEYVCFVLWVLQ